MTEGIQPNDIKLAMTIGSCIVAALLIIVSGTSYCMVQQYSIDNQKATECIKAGGDWTISPPNFGTAYSNYVCIHRNS